MHITWHNEEDYIMLEELTNALKTVALDSAVAEDVEHGEGHHHHHSGNWNESQHPRDHDGKFTSGSGQGRRRHDDDGHKEDGDGKKDELDPEAMRKIIKGAFSATGGGLVSLEQDGGEFKASVRIYNQPSAYRKVNALNAVLAKHDMTARISNPKDYNEISIRAR